MCQDCQDLTDEMCEECTRQALLDEEFEIKCALGLI
jgi:hypothetical protein